MKLHATITACLLPFVCGLDANRKPREINAKSPVQLGLNLIPPDVNSYQNEEKVIYKCKETTNNGYYYDAPRVQLVEDPNNVGYKVAGPKIVYIDCTTTTRKPNTEKVLHYHFNLSFTNYPANYTTEKYEPVTFRSTPGRRYLPDGPVTSHPFSSVSANSGTTRYSVSSSTRTISSGINSFTGQKFSTTPRPTQRTTLSPYIDLSTKRPLSFPDRPSASSSTPTISFGINSFTGQKFSTTLRPTQRTTLSPYIDFSTKRPLSFTDRPSSLQYFSNSKTTKQPTPFSFTTSASKSSSTYKFDKTQPFIEFTSRTTSKPSTSGLEYLPPKGSAFHSNFNSYDY